MLHLVNRETADERNSSVPVGCLSCVLRAFVLAFVGRCVWCDRCRTQSTGSENSCSPAVMLRSWRSTEQISMRSRRPITMAGPFTSSRACWRGAPSPWAGATCARAASRYCKASGRAARCSQCLHSICLLFELLGREDLDAVVGSQREVAARAQARSKRGRKRQSTFYVELSFKNAKKLLHVPFDDFPNRCLT